jgi:hypothetical protein
MKRLAAVLLWLFLPLTLLFSQTAIVTRNVNLRSDPSTEQDAIVKFVPPAQIQLLDPDPTNGFYHVKSGENEGWVWGRNIKIQAGAPVVPPPSQPTSGAGGLIEQAQFQQFPPAGTRAPFMMLFFKVTKAIVLKPEMAVMRLRMPARIE